MPDYWLLWHHRIRSKVPFDTRSQPFASHLAIRTSQQDPRTGEDSSEPVRWHVERWKWLGPWLHDLLALVPIGPGLLHFVCRDLWPGSTPALPQPASHSEAGLGRARNTVANCSEFVRAESG